MKNVIIISLLFIGLYGCTDDENNVKRVSFSISAKDVNTNLDLSGGQYKVTDDENNVVGTYTLDQGTIEVTGLPPRNYTIEEVSPPKGYVGSEKKKFYIQAKNKLNTFVFQYIDILTRAIPQSVNLKFTADNGSVLENVTGIRIGEYYWMDRNFTCKIPWGNDFENAYPITQPLLDRYVERIRISTDKFQLDNIDDFEKGYGRYYSYPSVLFMNQKCLMTNQYNEKVAGWKLPSHEDYRQLFAMCPFNTTADPVHTHLNERDVRFALGPKPGENSMAFNIANEGGGPFRTYWFDAKNSTNKYKFGLMPGGARLNGDGRWCNGLGPNGGCYNDGKKGDFYGLFYTAYLATDHPDDALAIGFVRIAEQIETTKSITYHLLNARWCRRLSDIELGYKLYINAAQTDIKKLSLDAPIPEGYKELPHGYVRGFYVQYILNNPNPTVTVANIVSYAGSVQDNYVRANVSNRDIVL